MSATGLDVFEKTVQKANTWLKEIMELQGWGDRNKAYLALRTVLHLLRDRLPMEEAVHFAAELPLILRGMFFEGWSPDNMPVRMSREDFLASVRAAFADDPEIIAEKIIKTVFKVLENRISQGEISDIKAILPRDLQEFWPSGNPEPGLGYE